jgi:hypothetical protein
MVAQLGSLFIDEVDNEEHSGIECDLSELRERIRVELLAHLALIGLYSPSTIQEPIDVKERIRLHHSAQRIALRANEQQFLKRYGRLLLSHFAEGQDIIPEEVEPYISLVKADTEDAAVFRLATLLWSVPVSRGYGRRLRFLVRDRSNGKLLGLFALTDPVFNLKARDTWIGWSTDERRQRLVDVMDAHIVGAVPPYSTLLGGKITAALMTSQEVCETFASRYNQQTGIISQQCKHAQLLLITVTSALGRSSLYNRLKLPGIIDFVRVGQTTGWGHFHIPQPLFLLMRELLQREGHPYASGHQFGQGPNWRLRVAREAIKHVGLDPHLLQHGINREVYGVPLVANWRECLCGKEDVTTVLRPSVETIGKLAVNRWLIPRASRRSEYMNWTRENTWELLTGATL